MRKIIASREGEARSILRIILGFVISFHGLLFAGLFVRPVAILLCAEIVWAYFPWGLPRGILPTRDSNGGEGGQGQQ